jgi:hypothetical protein
VVHVVANGLYVGTLRCDAGVPVGHRDYEQRCRGHHDNQEDCPRERRLSSPFDLGPCSEYRAGLPPSVGSTRGALALDESMTEHDRKCEGLR